MAELVTKYKQYAEYKDSGVKWLGEVPSHWEVTRAKFVSEVFVPQRNKPELNEVEGILWATMEDMANTYINQTAFRVSEKAAIASGSKKLPAGAVIASCVGNFGVTSINRVDVIINQQLQAFVPTNIKAEYLREIVFISKSYFELIGTAATLIYVNKQGFENLPVLLPSKQEQQTISNFLNYETTQIDTLIEKQQTLIQLLKEKRQAVISHAVTKGLNLDAPMKDSGVEWLGEVPAHWEVLAISKLTQKITNGYVGPTRDILVKQGVPYVQATHIKRGNVNFDDAYFVTYSWSRKHSKSILKRGDVLVVQTGAGTGDIGLVTEKEEGYNCHALIILQPKTNLILGSYLSLILQSSYGHSTLYSIRTGGMHPHLNCGEVKYVKVTTPTIDEQQKIVEYIESMKSKFDELTRSAEQAIQLMQERRTALISAAVTGKIDVRGWVAPE